MGILEDIQAKLLELHLKVDAMSAGTVLAAVETFDDASPGAAIPGIDSNVVLDTEGKPWDERIHSTTHNQTVKGVWKIRKGVDKTLIAQVKAETKPVAGAPVVQPAAATGKKPPTPGVVANTKMENTHKRVALEAINELTNNLGVEYDNIQQALVNKFDVDSFDKLPETLFESAADAFSGWKDDLGDINDIVTTIMELGAENGSAGVETICKIRGFKNVSQVTLDAIPEFMEALSEFKQQWIDYDNETE